MVDKYFKVQDEKIETSTLQLFTYIDLNILPNLPYHVNH